MRLPLRISSPRRRSPHRPQDAGAGDYFVREGDGDVVRDGEGDGDWDFVGFGEDEGDVVREGEGDGVCEGDGDWEFVGSGAGELGAEYEGNGEYDTDG
jgi:hypothetical protein